MEVIFCILMSTLITFVWILNNSYKFFSVFCLLRCVRNVYLPEKLMVFHLMVFHLVHVYFPGMVRERERDECFPFAPIHVFTYKIENGYSVGPTQRRKCKFQFSLCIVTPG